MRALLITVIVFGSIPVILKRPSIGILVWCWLSYMNPHRLSFGFAYDFPFAQVIAIATLIGILISAEPKQAPPVTGLTALWLAFFLWTGVTTAFGMYPDAALLQLERFAKVQIMTLATVIVICDRRRLNLLIWAIVLSIGFYGVKGGLFTLRGGGNDRVWGPEHSFISDNNALALALYMLLPLAFYLRTHSRHWFVRQGLLVMMILMVVSAVGSYSRGGFIAGLSIAVVLWLKSRSKILTGAVVALLVPLVLVFMPQRWHDRMGTITTYHEDGSAMNRLEAWEMAYNLANDRPLGGGFDLWSRAAYRTYGPPDSEGDANTRGAHSIYFSVLGEHGWIGLALFVSIFVAAWRTARWVAQETRDDAELEWLGDLARMVQVSLVAYATGGTFQSLAYFDYPWHLVAILVVARAIVERHEPEVADEPTPEPKLRLGLPRRSEA